MDLFAPRIRTTIASLRAGMPARIAVFNAEGNAQLDVPADDGGLLAPRRPGLGYVFGGMPAYGAGEFPVLEVAVPDAVADNVTIEQLTADVSASLVIAVWAGRTSGEEFPDLYEKVLGYARCATEVLLQPDAVGPGDTVERIRFAFAANPDRRDRDDMGSFTFGGFLFFTVDGFEQRP